MSSGDAVVIKVTDSHHLVT